MSFRPALVPSLVAAVLISIGVAAGFWQTHRAEQKMALKARIDAAQALPPQTFSAQDLNPEALAFHSVQVSGQWVSSATMFLDNRVFQGRPGYHVLTPLKLEGEPGVVLVNRGWVAGASTRDVLPRVSTPTTPITLTGQIRVPRQGMYSLGPVSTGGAVWQQIQIPAMAKASGLPLTPVVIFQQSAADDGLVRSWDRPDYGIDMHRGYAFQWFALACAGLVFFIVMSWKRSDHAS